ncbi:MAG: GFA family protein [Pseudomonadota bacterium]
MNTPKLPLEGSCLCGQVQIHVTEPPLLTFACHCRDCQKLCAGAYSLTAMFPTDSFSVAGELVIGGMRCEQRKHYFCPDCMNFIFSQIEGAEMRVNLRVSLLDDLTWFQPFVEVMTEEGLSWSRVPAAHSFARRPETAEELTQLMADYARR